MAAVGATMASRKMQPKCFTHFHQNSARFLVASQFLSVSPPRKISGSSGDVSKYRKGGGGRSSFSGLVATVFGASGYSGRYVTNRLAQIGSQVIVMYRQDPAFVKHCKPMGDLGQIIPLSWDINDDEAVRRAIKYSNVVINLVGKFQENHNYSFEDVHVEWPRRLGRLCKEMGVKTLLHVSSLNACPFPEPKVMRDGSKYMRTKYHGELAIREEFPETIIFRPSDMFGNFDRFVFYYAPFWRHIVPLSAVTEVWAKGEKTEKQPVFVGDFARGVVAAVSNPTFSAGKSFDIVGEHRYNLAQLMDFFMAAMRKDVDEYDKVPILLEYRRIQPTFVIKMRAAFSEKFPWIPYTPIRFITWERMEREATTDYVTPGSPGLEDLGVTDLTGLEDRALYELRVIRDTTGYGAAEDSGILDPLDMKGKYPPKLPIPSIQLV